jgi:WD40 repeat protein
VRCVHHCSTAPRERDCTSSLGYKNLLQTAAMSIATVQTRYCYGLKGNVANSVTYLDERNILYPSGANLVLCNAVQKTQKFVPLSPGTEGATALAVSPNKRYVAVAEKKGERPTITVFDLTTLKRKKVLSYAEGSFQEYVSLGFSPDSKSLVSQSGGPDWSMCLWQWEKAKVLAQIKSNGNTTYPIRQVSFNPQDNTQMCAVGEKTFKLFRLSEGQLKQFAVNKMNQLNYFSHVWVSEDQVLLGSDTGRLQLFEVGDLRNEFEVGATSQQGVAARQPSSRDLSRNKPTTPTASHVANLQIDCLALTSKGFICSASNGTLYVFDKTEDPTVFQEARSVRLSEESSSPEATGSVAVGEEDHIVSMSVSPSEETVVCATASQQLIVHTLSSSDLTKGLSASSFDYLSCSFHHGAVTGLDVCLRKPIIATCSHDKTIRVWNYENNSLDLHKEFAEEAYSVALHPSGLFVLVGFSEKLRLMNLLINDIRPYKEFLIRGCRECSFSHGGHLFAAANTNLIQIFSTFSFENTANLKGHNGKVRCIKWSQDDTQIVSCSMDGAVYEWGVLSGRRENECVVKSCSYTSLTLTPDLRTTFVVSTDSTLSEMILADSTVVRNVPTGDVLTEVVLSGSGRMLFAGSSSGSVRSLKFPLSEAGEFTEHQTHSAPITRMRISYDDSCLFSVAQDGSLFCHRVSDKDGRGYRKDKDTPFAEEVLVTKADMEELNSELSEYKNKVGELRSENDYQLRLKDMNYGEKIKEMRDSHADEMEKLRTQYETLRTDREREQADYEARLGKMDEDHSATLQEMDDSNNKKLMTEYEKYQELQARSLKLQEVTSSLHHLNTCFQTLFIGLGSDVGCIHYVLLSYVKHSVASVHL